MAPALQRPVLPACLGGVVAVAMLGSAPIPGEPPPIPTDSSWSYEPVQRPGAPRVRDTAWPSNDIDAFILARLEAAGLAPAARADRRTLIRRATYDLTGLPPTPEEVEAFVADESPDAYERLLDRLLASPHYGEKWGRHWLDLVRWAETDSYERDRLKPGAWRYRDWVIDALNADMPYDKFITMQLAGDELPERGLAQHIATGYLHLGIRDDEPTDPLQAVFDDLDGMLDTTCRVMLGVSMGCARCHDHKADPIPIRDYYRMLAFFEGLKPYKEGGGNGITTEHFVRRLPADLGSDGFERALEQWSRERAERLGEVRSLMAEVGVRWGEAVVAEARAPLAEGRLTLLSFEDDPEQNTKVGGVERVPGLSGSAARFDGDEEIRLERRIADDLTVAFWLRAEAPGAGDGPEAGWFAGSGLVDAEVDGVTDDFGVALLGDRVVAGVGNPNTYVAGPAGTADGEWRHVAFTRERGSGRIALYLDGTHVAEGVGGTQALTAAETLAIGRIQTGGNPLVGELDEIGIWERALDPREVLDLAIGGGALPECAALVRERLGEAEGARLESAVLRLLQLRRPEREMVEVLAAQEVESPPASFVRVRGMAAVTSDPVSPAFPEILGGGSPEIGPPEDAETSGRRLALAHWIASPDNPRTARVLANRLWQHHFGRGIVRSPNEFGELGERPTHPELLDYLAGEIIDGGWRLKRMHKLIMMSSAYRMASAADPGVYEADPVNDLFSRFDPRRLTAEEVRDSILAVNESLNLEMGGPGVYPPMPQEVLATSSRPDEAWGRSSPEDSARRSIYVHVKRSLLMPMLTGLDMADTDSSCTVRFVSTQPTQALTMLNSDFMGEQAGRLASRVRGEAGDDPRDIVRRAFELVTTRSPTDREVAEGVALIDELTRLDGLSQEEAIRSFCLVALNLNEFVYLD